MVIPLFPLHAVLFPGGPLRLRIFEPRYLDMIARCMRSDTAFGVAMIVEGEETGAARSAAVGTTARIRDFEALSGGLLGLTGQGETRFRIQSVQTQRDGLNVAEVELLAADVSVSVPSEYASLTQLVRQMYPQVSLLYGDAPSRFDEAGWVSARVAELLPLSLAERQHCLELDDPVERLAWLEEAVREGDRG